MNAYLINKAERYDVKGRKYIKTPVKYYYTDPGLRNARPGFRQIEETHLMENVLYNDLVRRRRIRRGAGEGGAEAPEGEEGLGSMEEQGISENEQ